MLTFTYAVGAVLNWNGVEGLLDFPGSIEGSLVYQVIKPRVAEYRFDFRKNWLDWVQSRTVRDIVDGHDVERSIHSLHLLSFMHCQIVTKQSEWTSLHPLSQSLKVPDKVPGVHGFVMYAQ